MSEKCIIYRPLKHEKRLKTGVRTELSVDPIILKTFTSPLRFWINSIQNFCFFIPFF